MEWDKTPLGLHAAVMGEGVTLGLTSSWSWRLGALREPSALLCTGYSEVEWEVLVGVVEGTTHVNLWLVLPAVPVSQRSV